MATHELPLPKLELAPDPLTTHADFVAKRKARQVGQAAHYYSSGSGGGLDRRPPNEGKHVLAHIVTLMIFWGGIAASLLAGSEVAEDYGEKAGVAVKVFGSIASFIAAAVVEAVFSAMRKK